ncbi:MAG: MDR family oxidoreductase [Bryobacteraceae bacterium]
MATFKAFLVTKGGAEFAASFEQIDKGALPPGEVLVRVAFSSLNYKDGLAVTGRPGVIRKCPMVPGIDLAGVVEESRSSEFKPGDRVVVTGCGTSETMWGGYAELARLDGEFLVPVPESMTLKQAAGIGTAGFAAMQSIMALEIHGLKPGGLEVLVTGASGGVGSIAIAALANLGYRVAAATGRAELHPYLRSLGASEIADRADIAATSSRPLETQRWSGAIDNVGGPTLAGLLRSVAMGGSVASVGLAGGAEFTSTVFPFILRGVNLLGIDSARVTNAQRRAVWARLARDLPLNLLDQMITVEPLEKICELGEQILAGKIRGRTVIEVSRD